MSAVDSGLGVFISPKSSQADVLGRQRDLNTRFVPPELEAIQEISEARKVYIFNVGPWQHIQYMGSLGRKIVPACPEGQKYSEPLVIPGIVEELYPDTEKSMKRIHHDGLKFAEAIVGIGPHMLPGNSLTRVGVAICKQWPPKKEEIAAAWNALAEGELADLIREANSAAATGPKAMEETISPRHYMAARLLNKGVADCPWIGRATETRARVECKFCGEPMKTGIPRCPNCKEIVDQELYDKLSKK